MLALADALFWLLRAADCEALAAVALLAAALALAAASPALVVAMPPCVLAVAALAAAALADDCAADALAADESTSLTDTDTLPLASNASTLFARTPGARFST